MRSLNSNLTTAQNQMNGQIISKIVLTGGYTYYAPGGSNTSNNIMRIVHSEQPWSQTAKVLLDNHDSALSSILFEGLTGTISYGYNVNDTDYYSACAPLKVKAQEMVSSGGSLTCLLDLYGTPDQMANQKASADYSLTSSDTQTVKTLITAIMGATMACFNHTTAITVTYDSEDSLIDTFKPADYFSVKTGQTRKAKVQELLAYTKCVGIFKADGAFHIFSPIVSGTTYDYEYNDIILSTNHTFFSKVYRNRLVSPSKITVRSSPDHSPQYSGSATDIDSYALIPDEQDFILLRLASDAQGTAIAAAKIQRLQVEHEKGNGFAPMNCGQEVYDYIKITDSREGDNRVGNIGYLTRTFDISNSSYPYSIGFGFGDIMLGGFTGVSVLTKEQPFVTYADFQIQLNEIYANFKAIQDFENGLLNRTTVPYWNVTEQLRIPVKR